MKQLLAGLVFITSCASVVSAAQNREADRLTRAAEVVNEVMGTPEKGIPHDLLNRAVCVGVIPSQLKLAIGLGGSFGRGVLICRRGGNGPWGAPSMFTVGGANFGLQLGGQATDFVLIVMNAKGNSLPASTGPSPSVANGVTAGILSGGRRMRMATARIRTVEILRKVDR